MCKLRSIGDHNGFSPKHSGSASAVNYYADMAREICQNAGIIVVPLNTKTVKELVVEFLGIFARCKNWHENVAGKRPASVLSIFEPQRPKVELRGSAAVALSASASASAIGASAVAEVVEPKRAKKEVTLRWRM